MVRSHPFTTHGRRQQHGVLLLEGLVAILLFSFAVLALVGLQARMVSAQTDSKFRADAGLLANELLARMWSDTPTKTGVNTYNGLACAANARCKDWQDKVASQLPNGRGSVLVDATSQMVTVTVNWKQGSETAHTYSLRSRLATAGDL